MLICSDVSVLFCDQGIDKKGIITFMGDPRGALTEVSFSLLIILSALHKEDNFHVYACQIIQKATLSFLSNHERHPSPVSVVSKRPLAWC